MIQIQVNENVATLAAELPENLVSRTAHTTFIHMETSLESEITLVLTDDAQLQELNREYLDIDAPTDVLSFPAGDIDPESRAVYLGDILISLPRAQAQALQEGHPFQEEIQLLIVHGMLHLLGFDHALEDDKAAMWAEQAAILTELGCPGVIPSA